MNKFTEISVAATNQYLITSVARRTSKLVLGGFLIVFGTTLPVDVSAVNNTASHARQRMANKAGLSKSLQSKRMFTKTERHESLKRDALPQTPRRGQKKNASDASE